MNSGDVVAKVVSALGYPQLTHGVINQLSDSTSLAVAPSTQIAPLCSLRGTIDLEPGVRLSTGCLLNGDVTVGKYTNFEPECEMIGDVEIGSYCAIGPKNIFQQTNHEMKRPSVHRRLYHELFDRELSYDSKGTITVGSDVWFGTRCIVLSGVTIGHGAVIAAGSVVTDDVEPYAMVAGTPATRIGWRFSEEIREALLELSWWDWDDETIREHQEFFNSHIQTVDDVPLDEHEQLHGPVPNS
ncbi:CatB-related O-acetyltransferase [Natrialbaceae archaeon A-arb3/5]